MTGWQRMTWLAGLIVAVGAAIATAHGLYEVVRATGYGPLIAGLYPLITDGLALVAYAGTARLVSRGQHYAAAIVVLAAGLSGLAQAVYLAGGIGQVVPVPLRFGIGAWPAIAAIIAAHLVHLMRTAPAPGPVDHPGPVLDRRPAVTPGPAGPNHRPAGDEAGPPTRSTITPRPVHAGTGPQQRAEQAAQTWHNTFGTWPSTRQLADATHVSKTTATRALRKLTDDHTESPTNANGKSSYASSP